MVGRAQPPTIVFLINSDISAWLRARADLRDCQVVMHKRDHDFLVQDSFLDCTWAERRVSLEHLEHAMMNDMTSFKGWLTAYDREAVLYSVQVCRTLSAKEKGWLAEALSPQK